MIRHTSLVRVSIIIRGAVQGVGFRPFVYRLATELHLNGRVSNSNEGVQIEAEGSKEILDQFVLRLQKEHPRHASIHSLEYSLLDALGFTTFEICRSGTEGPKRTVILPDIATCADCLEEIFDCSNRRYLYPFTNCTNCGPRFTIIENLPYDRLNTTMHRFEMCGQCRREYEDPEDRRFHAQPNACAACGPHLEIWNAAGQAVAYRAEAVRCAIDCLRDGAIVAVKGLGGFHLMVDARNEEAVVRLRELKHRESKPFAIMAPSLQSVREICVSGALEERLLLAPESPIVLLSRINSATTAPSVAPNNPYLGVMLPYTPLHHILMREFGRPVVATSGNRSDEPIAIDEYDAIRRLHGIADLFLVHNRPIRRHADDSIARIILGRVQVLRRARGYAPLPLGTKGTDSSVRTLAVGGHVKNTVAVSIGTSTFISQHIGDLETNDGLTAFRRVIDDFSDLYEVLPHCVAGDLHPDYASAAHGEVIASSRAIPFVRVQHHWAHVLSCMAENEVEPPALGVAWDGTGYGPDGTIWGGEFLVAAGNGFQRAAHFRTFPLPGGDAAVKNPDYIAAGVLYEIFGMAAFRGDEPQLLRQMLIKGFRSPRTSSAGRLFDAVAALTGSHGRIGFEGQAAMELEFAAEMNVPDSYDYGISANMPHIVDWEPMIRQIVDDTRGGVSRSVVSAKFHNTLAEIIVDIARRIGEPRVVLTGGCFQNRYLTERTVQRLDEAGFSAYWHQRVPPNDGGIALGQAMAARMLMGRETKTATEDEKELRMKIEN